MKSKKNYLKIGALIVVAVVCALGLVSNLSLSKDKKETVKEAVRPVKTVLLIQNGETEKRSYPGIAQARREVKLSFRVGGPLITFEMETGQRVSKGEVIAGIDTRDFRIRVSKLSAAIREAKSNLKVMKKGARKEDLESRTADVRASRAQLLEAELNYKRYESLFKEKAASKSIFDRMKAAYDMAKAREHASVQNLKKARKGARAEDVDAMEARIAGLKTDLRAAQNALEDTVIKCPFNGFIDKTWVENYESVVPGQPIVSVLDLGKMEVRSAIPEEMVVRKKDFTRFVCEFEAFPNQKFNATLSQVGKKTASANQSYPITLKISKKDCCRTTPGMAATVTIELNKTGTSGNGYLLPVASVFADEKGEDHIWIVDEESMKVKKVPVVLGQLAGDTIQLVSGGLPEARVVTAGAKFLRQGQKVRLLERTKRE